MGIKIGVLGNCDTGAITTSLRQLVLEASVTPLALKGAGLSDYLDANLPDFDLIFVNSSTYVADRGRDVDPRVIVYPQITFRPFHPDCCYVWLSNNSLIENYNSAICVGCFVRGLSVEQTVSCFNKEVYDYLGYFSRWDDGVKKLKHDFEHYNVDFTKFFLRAKRSGVFMHSINHPTKDAFTALSALLAMKIGASEDALDKPVFFPDPLANFAWPVYPEIGEIFSAPGAYVWLYAGKYLGLHDFISAEFDRYKSKGLTREGIRFADACFQDKLDALLGVPR